MKFKIGNVLKNGNQIIIVTEARSDKIHWVSLEYTGVLGSTYYENQEYEEDCDCLDSYDELDEDCPYCLGSFRVTRILPGCKNATLLANNVKEYIQNRLLQNFEIFKR